jgi:hypothetical protein
MSYQHNKPSEKELRHLPEPTFIYKIGERVKYGNWDYTEVLEVHEGGKYYKCYIETKNIVYGKYEGQKQDEVYLKCVNLLPYRPKEEWEKIEQLEEDKDIRFSYSQRNLESLLYLLYRDVGLDLNPDYQRGNVWGLQQKKSLIESIFKNIDIGKFTIIRRPFKEDLEHYYEVLDGKQRIIAASEFFEGRYTYRGKRYQDLHPFDQYHFRDYAISYAETEPLTNEQKYRYFLKLNTTGQPHDQKHLDKVKEMWEKEKSE